MAVQTLADAHPGRSPEQWTASSCPTEAMAGWLS